MQAEERRKSEKEKMAGSRAGRSRWEDQKHEQLEVTRAVRGTYAGRVKESG